VHILDKIVAHKKIEINKNKEQSPVSALEASPLFERKCISFSEHIKDKNRSGVISEFKRRSPSKPTINLEGDPSIIPNQYCDAGVSAISVLTDEHFFGGNAYHLSVARSNVKCPILRKDFIIDEYQIIEAKSIGADAILLITEILSKTEITQFASFAVSLGLEVLMEVHTKEQIDKYHPDVSAIGINNRDLTTFTVDPEHSVRLYPHLPREVCKVSESGIHDIPTMIKLKQAGFDGFLIGERFMKTKDPGMACKTFIEEYNTALDAL